MKPRRFVVQEKTFGLTVEFYLGSPQAAALRRCAAVMELPADDPDSSPDEAACAWMMSHNSWSLVWVERPDDTASLVHELYHVTQDALRHIESNDEETGAYLISYLFREAWRRLSRR